MAEALRLFRYDVCLDRDLLGVGALDPLIADPEYRVADLQIGDFRADGADDAREIAAENVRELDTAAAVGASAQPHLVVGRVYAGRVYVDDDFARSGNRVRNLGEMQHLGPAMPVEQHCLHQLLPCTSTLAVTHKSSPRR